MYAENTNPGPVVQERESVNVVSKVVQATEEQKQMGHAETFTVREAQPKPPQGNLVPAMTPSPAAVAPVSAVPVVVQAVPESTPPLYGGTYGSAPPATNRPRLVVREEEQCNCCDFILAVILAFLLTVATLSILGYPVEEWAGLIEYGESDESDSLADSEMEVCAPGDAMCVARNAQRTANKALREVREHKAAHKPFEDLKNMLDNVGALAKPLVKQLQKESRRPRVHQIHVPCPRRQQRCRRQRVSKPVVHRLSQAMSCKTGADGVTRCTVNGRPVSHREAAAVAQHMDHQARGMEADMHREMRDIMRHF